MSASLEIYHNVIKKNKEPDGAYCLTCGAPCIDKPISINGEEVYVCTDSKHHQSSRVLLFDEKVPHIIKPVGIVHHTVGIIVEKKEQNDIPFFLLFFRRKYPFQYTIPAGHVEKNLSSFENAKKELFEETGIPPEGLKKLDIKENQLFFKDQCRRGADYHQWEVYHLITDHHPTLSDEGRIIGWYEKNEIDYFYNKKLITDASYQVLKQYWSGKPFDVDT